MKFLSALLASASLAAATLPIITIQGNAFWNSETGDRFYIRGVDYQPSNNGTTVDNLADEEICSRDIAYLKELGANTIRVYSIDNAQDHTTCMNLLDEAGIYLILDVNTADASISRSDPECSYNSIYLQQIFSTVDEFANYTNVLGFFAGNEVINDMENTTAAAPYVKAVVRDLKQYMRARSYRAVPVGYSAADVTSNVYETAAYFNCGDDEDARIDMFGVNDYSWCGSSSFTTSGYSQKVKNYADYSIPIFFSEFGCNTVGDTRAFSEIGTIYSERMTGVFSGGLVFEYSEEANKYGLVEIDEDGEVTLLGDYDNLKAQLNSTSDPEGDGGYNANGTISECPAVEEGVWDADTSLPEMPSAASIYFTSGAGEPLGTDAGNTQLGCYADGAEEEEESSSTESKSSSSSSSSSSSASSSTSEESGSNTASSSASSSSTGAAGAVRAPQFYQAVVSIDAMAATAMMGLFALTALMV